MPTEKHYFVEQNKRGKFTVRAKGAKRASAVLESQNDAIERAKELNAADHADIERVRNVANGGRDQWRSAKKKTA
jgi:uncharacterized protein YdaT